MAEIQVVKYNSEYRELWNSFVKQAKNGLFMFDRNYMEYHSDRFEDYSLMFFEEEKIVAVLPASLHGKTIRSHGGLTYGGFLVDNSMKQHTMNDCVDALVGYSKENDIEEIIYKPIPHVFHLQPAEEDIYSLFSRGAVLKEVAASTVLNLKAPLKMPKGRKAQISRAKREGVEIKLLEEKKDYEDFISLENEVLNSRHSVSAVHTAEELFLLHSRFPENIHLYGAIYESKMIAGTVIFEYENAIHTQYMASSDLGRTIGALDLTISRVMENYKESKDWLDFGISTEDHGTVLNEGLIAQKEGFGGRTNIYSVMEIKL